MNPSSAATLELVEQTRAILPMEARRHQSFPGVDLQRAEQALDDYEDAIVRAQ